MCSLEHDTCANMFPSSLHKNAPRLKLNLQTPRQFATYYFIPFPFKLGPPPDLSRSATGIGDRKEQRGFRSRYKPGQALLQPLEKLSSDSRVPPGTQTHARLRPNSA